MGSILELPPEKLLTKRAGTHLRPRTTTHTHLARHWRSVPPGNSSRTIPIPAVSIWWPATQVLSWDRALQSIDLPSPSNSFRCLDLALVVLTWAFALWTFAMLPEDTLRRDFCLPKSSRDRGTF